MKTYIYSKWINSPADSPIEFYSEIDAGRFEVRKVEVFIGGRMGYASKSICTGDTKLGIVPVPTVIEIDMQSEFIARTISKQEFEEIWKKATNR